MNRIVALAWGVAAILLGALAVSIALGPKADESGWWLVLAFAAASAICAWRARADSLAPEARASAPGSPSGRIQPAPATNAPGAWRGAPVPLESQIVSLKEAGLVMMPGRTIDELLLSWPRADYETDPYNLLLFMYGSEVESNPSGRYFCARGWNFDMECLSERGDYVRAFEQIVRITGQPELVEDLSDTFDPGAELCEIRYKLRGRETVLRARVDNDWADPKAAAAFMLGLESAIGDGRRFWAADNGQASVLFFVEDAEAAKINALRGGVLQRYVLG